MMSCKELVKNVNTDEPKSFFKRAETRLHLIMCKHCSNYVKQLELMKVAFKNLFHKIGQVEPMKIRDLENKIVEKIKKSS